MLFKTVLFPNKLYCKHECLKLYYKVNDFYNLKYLISIQNDKKDFFKLYLEEATDWTSSVSSPMDDSISDDIIDDVSVAVTVPPPTRLVKL